MAKTMGQTIKEGMSFPQKFIGGRMKKSTQALENLVNDQGAIVEINGQKIAAYKDSQGKVITLSPVCQHLGCLVGWNEADKTWDCPCHGSRYEADGRVKQGPTKKGLKPVLLG